MLNCRGVTLQLLKFFTPIVFYNDPPFEMAFFGIFQTVGAGWTRVLPGYNWHQIAGNLMGILILGIFGGVT